ncbi:hypothetical protein C2G38_1597863 [Gigaspora rosea]|uniref:Uncharacterized protein n=1 Tax=Gigaspora rosea TaxID=44941 RepID=A0A397V2G1_9GLOM|nr:hypothetical protein C2G38_1597863 [Gigaspora rosea]
MNQGFLGLLAIFPSIIHPHLVLIIFVLGTLNPQNINRTLFRLPFWNIKLLSYSGASFLFGKIITFVLKLPHYKIKW